MTPRCSARACVSLCVLLLLRSLTAFPMLGDFEARHLDFRYEFVGNDVKHAVVEDSDRPKDGSWNCWEQELLDHAKMVWQDDHLNRSSGNVVVLSGHDRYADEPSPGELTNQWNGTSQSVLSSEGIDRQEHRLGEEAEDELEGPPWPLTREQGEHQRHLLQFNESSSFTETAASITSSATLMDMSATLTSTDVGLTFAPAGSTPTSTYLESSTSRVSTSIEIISGAASFTSTSSAIHSTPAATSPEPSTDFGFGVTGVSSVANMTMPSASASLAGTSSSAAPVTTSFFAETQATFYSTGVTSSFGETQATFASTPAPTSQITASSFSQTQATAPVTTSFLAETQATFYSTGVTSSFGETQATFASTLAPTSQVTTTAGELTSSAAATASSSSAALNATVTFAETSSAFASSSQADMSTSETFTETVATSFITFASTPQPTTAGLNATFAESSSPFLTTSATDTFQETEATSFLPTTSSEAVTSTPVPPTSSQIVTTTRPTTPRPSTSAALTTTESVVTTTAVSSTPAIVATASVSGTNETFTETSAMFSTSFFIPTSSRAATTRVYTTSSTSPAVTTTEGVPTTSVVTTTSAIPSTSTPSASTTIAFMFTTSVEMTTTSPLNRTTCPSFDAPAGCDCGLYGAACNTTCNMTITCNGNGRCNALTGGCACFSQWSGDDCSLFIGSTTAVEVTAPPTSTFQSSAGQSTAAVTQPLPAASSSSMSTSASMTTPFPTTTAAGDSTSISATPAASGVVDTTQGSATMGGGMTTAAVTSGEEVGVTSDAQTGSTVNTFGTSTTPAIVVPVTGSSFMQSSATDVSSAVTAAPTALTVVVISSVVVLEDGAAPASAVVEARDGAEVITSGITYMLAQISGTPGLFSVDPSISAAGIVDFALTADANGESSWEVTVSDGTRTSEARVLSINVTSVNDAPSVEGVPVELPIDGDFEGVITDLDFLTSLSAGPSNEDGQTLTWSVSGDLRSVGIDYLEPGSDLTKLTLNATKGSGTAVITLTVSDDGGVKDGGVDSSSQTFTIVRQRQPTTFAESVEAVQTSLGELSVRWSHPDVTSGQRGISAVTSFYVRVLVCGSENKCFEESFAADAIVQWDGAQCDTSSSMCSLTFTGLGNGWHQATIYSQNSACEYIQGCSKAAATSVDKYKLLSGPSQPLDVAFTQRGTLDASTNVFEMSWSPPADYGDSLPASDPQRERLLSYDLEIVIAGTAYQLTDLPTTITVRTLEASWTTRDSWSLTLPGGTAVSGTRGDQVLFRVRATNTFDVGLYGSAPSARVMNDPGAVASLSAAERIDSSGIDVSWDLPTDTGFGDSEASIDSYRVEISKCADFDASEVFCAWRLLSVFGNQTSMFFGGGDLDFASVYYFRVTPQNFLGFGLVSNVVSSEFKILPSVLAPLQFPIFAAITDDTVDVWGGSEPSSALELLVSGFPAASSDFTATFDGGLVVNPTFQDAGDGLYRIVLDTLPAGPTFGACTVSPSRRCEVGVSIAPSDSLLKFVRIFLVFFTYPRAQVLESFPQGGSKAGDAFVRLRLEEYHGVRTREGAGLAHLLAGGSGVTATFTCTGNAASAADVRIETDAATQAEAGDGVLRIVVSMYAPASPCDGDGTGLANIELSTADGVVPLSQGVSYEYQGPRIDVVTPSSGMIVDGSGGMQISIVLRDVSDPVGTIGVTLGDETRATNGGGFTSPELYTKVSDREAQILFLTPTYHRSRAGPLLLSVTGFSEPLTTNWTFVAPRTPTFLASSIMVDGLSKDWISSQMTSSTVSFMMMDLSRELGWNLITVDARITVSGVIIDASSCTTASAGPNLEVECTWNVAQFTAPSEGRLSVTVSDSEALRQTVELTETGSAVAIGIRDPSSPYALSFAATEGPAGAVSRILVGVTGAAGLLANGASVDFGGFPGTVNGIIPLDDWNRQGAVYQAAMVSTNLWADMRRSGAALVNAYDRVIDELNAAAAVSLDPAFIVLTAPADGVGAVAISLTSGASTFVLGREFRFIASQSVRSGAIGRTSRGGLRAGKRGGARFYMEFSRFPIVLDFTRIVVIFGGIRVRVAQMVFSTKDSTGMYIGVPEFDDVGQVEVQIYEESQMNNSATLSFEFFDDGQPAVTGFSQSQVYNDGGYALSVSFSNFPQIAEPDTIAISFRFSDQSVATANASEVRHTPLGTTISLLSVPGPSGDVLVVVSSFGKTTSFQLQYVAARSVPAAFTAVAPSAIVCDGTNSIRISIADLPRVSSKDQLSMVVNNVAVDSDAFTMISTFEETLIILDVPPLTPASAGVLDPASLPNDIDSLYPAMFDVAGGIGYPSRGTAEYAITGRVTCLNPFSPIMEYVYPPWISSNFSATLEVGVRQLGIVTTADISVYSDSHDLAVLSARVISSSDQRTLVAVHAVSSMPGEHRFWLAACSGGCAGQSSRNISVPIKVYDSSPRVGSFTPSKEFVSGGTTLSVQVLNLDPDSPFSAATLNLDASTTVSVDSVMYMDSTAVFHFTLPSVREPMTYPNPTISIHNGSTLSLPNEFAFVASPKPTLERMVPSSASTMHSIKVRLYLNAFPGGDLSQFSVQMLWVDGTLMPATIIALTQVDESLEPAKVQSFLLDIATPVGVPEGGVTCIVWNTKFGPALASLSGFRFVDSTKPITARIESPVAAGADAVRAALSQPSEVSLTISNAPDVSAGDYSVKLNDADSNVLRTSRDRATHTTVAVIEVPGASVAGTVFGFLAFGDAGSCSTDCCQSFTCTSDCPGVSISCFAVTYFDDTRPTVQYRPANGPASGGTVVSLLLGGFPTIGDASEVVAFVGENMTSALAPVVLRYSHSDQTAIDVIVPAADIGDAATMSAQVNIVPLLRTDRAASFWFTYSAVQSTLRSFNPPSALNTGGVAVTVTIDNFPFPTAGVAVIFDGQLVATENVSTLAVSNAHATSITFVTLASAAGIVPVAVVPKDCGVDPCPSLVMFDFEQIDADMPVLVRPIAFRGPIQNVDFPPVRFGKWPASVASFNVSFVNTTHVLPTTVDIITVDVATTIEFKLPIGIVEGDYIVRFDILETTGKRWKVQTPFTIYDGAAIYVANVFPPESPTSTYVDNRNLQLRARVSVVLANLPQGLVPSDLQVFVGAGLEVEVDAVSDLAICAPSSIDCLRTRLSLIVPAVDSPGEVPVEVSISSVGTVVNFDLTFVPPCDWDTFCGESGSITNFLQLLALPITECKLDYCADPTLIPDLSVLFTTPAEGLTTGGTAVTIEFESLPALSTSDVTVSTGAGATKWFAQVLSIQHHPGSTLLQNRGLLTLLTPPVLPDTAGVSFVIQTTVGGHTIQAPFDFAYLPVITGSPTVVQFSPKILRPSQSLKLVAELANFPKLSYPFDPAEVLVTIPGLISGPMAVDAVLASTRDTTAVVIRLTPPGLWSVGTLPVSIFAASMGPENAATISVSVASDPDPFVQSVFPREALVGRTVTLAVKIMYMDTSTTAADVSVQKIVVDQTGSALNVFAQVVDILPLHDESCSFRFCSLFEVVVEVPPVSADDLRGGSLVTMTLSSTLEAGTIAAEGFGYAVRMIGLFDPKEQTLHDAGTEPITIYTTNFPSENCTLNSNCATEADDLAVDFGGFSGTILTKVDVGSLLEVTVLAPRISEPATVDVVVLATNFNGEFVSMSPFSDFEYIAPAPLLGPVDGITNGGTIVMLTVYGWGQQSLTVTSPEKVSCLFGGRDAIVIDILDVQFSESISFVQMLLVSPAAPGLAAGSAVCTCTMVDNDVYSSTFLFEYYDAPQASADPRYASLSGETARNRGRQDQTRSFSTVVTVVGFPAVESTEDLEVYFSSTDANPDELTTDLLADVIDVELSGQEVFITVTVPPSEARGAAAIWVRYAGSDKTGAIRDEKWASAPFEYRGEEAHVKKMDWCEACNAGSSCLQSRKCAERVPPLAFAAPTSGGGVVSVELKGVPAVFFDSDTGQLFDSTTFSISIGPAFAVFQRLVDNRRERVEFEMSLPSVPRPGTFDGVITLSFPGQPTPITVPFEFFFFPGDVTAHCSGCEGPTTGASPVTLRIRNMALSTETALLDQVSITFGEDRRPAAAASLISSNDTITVIDVTPPSYECDSCTFVNGQLAVPFTVSSLQDADTLVSTSYVFWAAPSILSATFGQQGTSITVLFDQPTNRAGMASDGSNCSAVLHPDIVTSGVLGMDSNGTMCVFDSDSSLRVFLSVGATFAPNDELTVKPNAIFSKNLISRASAALVVVRGPDRPRAPSVTVSGPDVIDSCAGLRLEAFASSPRFLTFAWDCEQCSDALRDVLKGFTGSVMQLEAGTSILENLDAVYSFSVTAVDFLGSESKTVTKTVRKLSTATPLVVFTPPTLSATYDEDILIRAQVSFSDCPIDTDNVVLSWTSTSNPAIPPQYMRSRTAELFIPANTLAAGNQYDVGLQIAMDGDRSKVSVVPYSFTVVRLPLVALIDHSDITVSTSSAFALDAGASFDRDTLTSTGLEFSWRCYLLVDGVDQSCLDVRNQLLQLNRTSVINVPANTLAASDYPYMFEVTIRKSGSSKSPARAVAMVTMLSLVVPTAGILAVRPSTLPRINAVDALVLQGFCTDASGGVQWSFDPPLAQDATLIPFGFSAMSFRIEPNAGLFVGGSVVGVQFSCVDGSGGVGQARMAFTVNSPPSSGSCSACKQSQGVGEGSGNCSKVGEALVDSFVLRCDGWADDEGDAIKYQFGSQVGDNPIVWGEVSNTLESVQSFPEGKVQVYFKVIDGLGAETETIIDHLAIAPMSARRSGTGGRRLLVLSSTAGLTSTWISNLDLLKSALQRQQGAEAVDLVSKLAAQAATQASSGVLTAAESMQITKVLIDALLSARAVSTETSGFVCSSVNAAQVAVGRPARISPAAAGTAVHLIGSLFQNLTTASSSCTAQSIDVIGNAVVSLKQNMSCGSSDAEARQASTIAADVLRKVEDAFDEVAPKFGASLTAGQGLQVLVANRSRHAIGLETLATVTATTHVLPLGDLVSSSSSAMSMNVTLRVPSSVVAALGSEVNEAVTVDFGATQTAPVVAGVKSLSPLVTVSLYDSTGAAVTLQDLADPISITIPFTSDSLCAAERARWKKTGTCMAWTGQEYSASGCTTTMRHEELVTCSCHHLSSFIVAADLVAEGAVTTAAVVDSTSERLQPPTTSQAAPTTSAAPTTNASPGTTAAPPMTTTATVVVTPDPPTFSVPSAFTADNQGKYPGFVEVTITPPASSAVSYTTNGADPVCPSSVFLLTAEVVLLKTQGDTNTLRARACHTTGGVSSVTSGDFEVKAAPFVRAVLNFAGVGTLTETMRDSLIQAIAAAFSINRDRVEPSVIGAGRRLLQQELSVQTDILATSLSEAADLSDEAKGTDWTGVINNAEGWEGATFDGASVSIVDPTSIPPIPEPQEDDGMSTSTLLAIIIPSVIGGLLIIGLCAWLILRRSKSQEPPKDPLQPAPKAADQRTEGGEVFSGHDDPSEVERRLMGGQPAEPAPLSPAPSAPVPPAASEPPAIDDAAQLFGAASSHPVPAVEAPTPTGFEVPREQYVMQPTGDVGVLRVQEPLPTVNPYTPAALRAAAAERAAHRDPHGMHSSQATSGITHLMDYPQSLYQSAAGSMAGGEHDAYGLPAVGVPMVEVPQAAELDYPQSLFADQLTARLADPAFGGAQELENQHYVTSALVFQSPPASRLPSARAVDRRTASDAADQQIPSEMAAYVPPWQRQGEGELQRTRGSSDAQTRYLPPWERDSETQPVADEHSGSTQQQVEERPALTSLDDVRPQLPSDPDPLAPTLNPHAADGAPVPWAADGGPAITPGQLDEASQPGDADLSQRQDNLPADHLPAIPRNASAGDMPDNEPGTPLPPAPQFDPAFPGESQPREDLIATSADGVNGDSLQPDDGTVGAESDGFPRSASPSAAALPASLHADIM